MLDRLRPVLEAIALVFVIVACGAVSWNAFAKQGASVAQGQQPRAEQPPMDTPVKIDPRKVLGSATAPVALVIFSDFHCPFCAKLSMQTMPRLKAEMVRNGRVSIAFKHMPLDELHPRAVDAAILSECAAAQGEFWNAHDAIFAIGAKSFAMLAENPDRLRLNKSLAVTCAQNPATRASVMADLADAQRLDISGTPTILVGIPQTDGTVRALRRLSGAPSVERLEEVVKAVLASRSTIGR